MTAARLAALLDAIDERDDWCASLSRPRCFRRDRARRLAIHWALAPGRTAARERDEACRRLEYEWRRTDRPAEDRLIAIGVLTKERDEARSSRHAAEAARDAAETRAATAERERDAARAETEAMRAADNEDLNRLYADTRALRARVSELEAIINEKTAK